MIDQIILGIICLWFLYAIAIRLTKKRKHDYSFFIALLAAIGYGYFYYYDNHPELYKEIYQYSVVGIFAFWMIVDNTLVLFKKNVSEFDFYHLEKELEEMKHSSELMRQRFISTIELLSDGIAFREDKGIFGTDQYIEYLGLSENEFKVDTLENIMVKDDLVQYRMIIEKLSKRNPVYSISYRIIKDNQQLWIKEKGKAIFIGKKKHIISIIRPMDVRRFPTTEVDVLNSLPKFKEMYNEMQRLTRKKTPYHLVVIQLTNIPKINEKYGRDFGDLMMGEYLSKLRFKFIKDNLSLFRISGIRFGLLIKDQKKFELLDRALVGTGEILTMRMKFGGVSQVIYPNLGISESPYEGKNPDDVYNEAITALERTEKESYQKSFAYYEK
ncbi:MAG: diguanylate cyclase [Candidatus Izemoplasma sp.]|nr:diguanylate cyclase [Candidatus Izemoplasma sp.]